MGKDGSTGMLEMKKQNAVTIAQDEKSSIVFGMPKEAIELGAVDMVAPLNKIADLIMKYA
jgi:two-component system chemotaxis response regulator CheB